MNSTEEDEVDTILENMKFSEFKERYRRLIPYMSYFVANNYVNSQVLGAPNPQAYERDSLQPSPHQLTRKSQRLVAVTGRTDYRNKSNPRPAFNPPPRNTLHKQENNFVPSVQYDPASPEKDYFAPVRYNLKLNYDSMRYSGSGLTDEYAEYGGRSQPAPHQQRPIVHQEATSSAILQHRDTQYYHNNGESSRLGGYDRLNERKYLSDNMNTRLGEFHHDYPLDYGAKISTDKVPISGTSDYSYGLLDNVEPPVRYVNVQPAQRHPTKPTRILAQSPIRRPLLSPLSYSFTPQQLYYSATNNAGPAASLDDIIKSLRLTDRLPEMLNDNNIDSSIRTLIEILGILNNAKPNELPRSRPAKPPRPVSQNNDPFKLHESPKVITETIFQATPAPPVMIQKEQPLVRQKPQVAYSDYEIVNNRQELNSGQYFSPLSLNIEEQQVPKAYKSTERTIDLEKQQEFKYEIEDEATPEIFHQQQKYNLPVTTKKPVDKIRLPNDGGRPPPRNDQLLVPPTVLKYGATRGKPNVDYPAYAVIPDTQFNCKEQRYKGFFGDPSTDCQVWHYCDLNGGKSSFLCPNGTIFSQVALTCDWWFNVKCESTTQLYVLNERLYKYILPIMPKFPEDFSGPEVDRYLELKFKEMEAKLKEKKLKKQQEKDKIKEKLQGLGNEE